MLTRGTGAERETGRGKFSLDPEGSRPKRTKVPRDWAEARDPWLEAKLGGGAEASS